MKAKGLKSPNDVRDALGLRIIVNQGEKIDGETDLEYSQRGNNMCYFLIQRLRSMPGWQPAANGFKDYISGIHIIITN